MYMKGALAKEVQYKSVMHFIPTRQSHNMNREYLHSVVVCEKYLTRLGELIIFEPWREKLSFLPTSLDIFIYCNTMYAFYLYFNVSFV